MGIAATQIAKRFGAEVYGTASPGKHERVIGARLRARAGLHEGRLGGRPS